VRLDGPLRERAEMDGPAARSPQDEDHEQDSFTIRWDDSMGCYRVSIPNYEGGEVVPIEVHRAALSRVSPSRVGSVAVEDVRAQTVAEIVAMLRENARLSVTDEARYFNEGLANKIEREFSRSSTDRPEQPEPDVLGGQPPAESDDRPS
jgi:hypothetical protein